MGSFLEPGAGNNDYCYLLDRLCKYGCVKVAVEIVHKRKSCGAFDPDAKM